MNLFDCEAIHINKIYSVKKYSGFAKPLSPKEYGIFFKTYKIVIYLSGIQKRHLQKAHEYIMENYRNPDFDYKGLCHASALEYAYFSELFKKTFKMSPVRFVTKLRIDYAKELLVTNRRSVSEIAEMSGFSNAYYFSTVFKKQTGFSPSQYLIEVI